MKVFIFDIINMIEIKISKLVKVINLLIILSLL